MSGRGLRRRLAGTLARWARRTLPASRSRWGEAMETEVARIEGDGPALRWALGCLAAAWRERTRAMKILDSPPVRLAVVLVIAFKILDDLFATALTVAYRSGALGVADVLGRQTPGDDFRRLTPLMEAVPLWLHALWVLAACLYLAAIVLFARRRRGAYLLVLAALAAETLAAVLGRPIVAAVGVAANPHPSLLAGVVIPFLLPLALAWVVWRAGREPGPLGTPG